MASLGVPLNVEQKTLIDKVAKYVAKNGNNFEEMMREKQEGNKEYEFLTANAEFNKYYVSKVRTEQIALKVKVNNCRKY